MSGARRRPARGRGDPVRRRGAAERGRHRAHVGDGRRRRGGAGRARRPLCRARRRAGRARRALAFPDRADLAHILRREREESRKLSRAAVETLAIIAYHEPVSRAEIEAIRGVQISQGHARRADGGGLGAAGRAARGAGPAAHLCDDAGLPRPFRAQEPARPARDRRSQGGGPARSGRHRARAARSGGRDEERSDEVELETDAEDA